MRILQLVDSLVVGGAERVVVNLALELQRRGHVASVAALRRHSFTGQQELDVPLRASHVPVFLLEKPEGPHLRTVSRLARILKQERVDVVHSHNPLVHHYAAAAGYLARTPVIVNTIHGIHNLERINGPALLYGASCWLSGAVVAVCERAREHFQSVGVLPARRLRTIYNGVPLEPFLALEPPDFDKAPGAGFLFGAIGRLVDVKDHTTLLRAFAEVVRQRPEARLEILGAGPLRASLEREIVSLGLTGLATLRGESLDVAAFLSTVDVFVHSSYTEALPMTLLEAMAAGRPAAVTNVGGLPEVVEAADCGWLCPPRDAAAMAAMMLKAMEDPALRRKMSANGRKAAKEKFSVEEMTSAYLALYKDLQAGGLRRPV